MADLQGYNTADRESDQALTALKKGAYLLKYGRRGRPKFCPFRLSPDESALIWYFGDAEKRLELLHVTRIVPGQRTPVFQRYPRPEKEYQSFSLLYNDKTLDLICKDKEEAEVWFAGLKSLIDRRNVRKQTHEASTESVSSESPKTKRLSTFSFTFMPHDQIDTPTLPNSRLGKAFADIVSFTQTTKPNLVTETVTPLSSANLESANGRTSASDTVRVSLSSAVSSSSQGSCIDDFDGLGDVFMWGEGTGNNGILGGGDSKFSGKLSDSSLPKALGLSTVLDVRSIACGSRQAVLVTKQGDVYSWGEELGGRLGHGVELDTSHPKLIDTFSGLNVETVVCSEFHSCAVTFSGDLYTWGNGVLGHKSEVSHWIPKRVGGIFEGMQVLYVSCGPWHTALVTSLGQLFTFGDGSFGALGHGSHDCVTTPREVEALKGLRTLKVACGVWHTGAVVEVMNHDNSAPGLECSRTLFTWGDGDKFKLGHNDNKSRLVPEAIASLSTVNFFQVACGESLTVGLTTSGRVYTMGSTAHGQLGSTLSNGKIPSCIGGNFADAFIEDISCGSHHVVALTSKLEVYTWGKGRNGQLGHGDYVDRNIPTIVDALKDKQVKSIACGSNFTAIICVHKSVSSTNNSTCSGCHNPFNFRRKRHNCYNCGLVFCNTCTTRKSLKASLAPSTSKPFRVCDDCFNKLQKSINSASLKVPKVRSQNEFIMSRDIIGEKEKENGGGPLFRLSASDSFNTAKSRISNTSSVSPLNGDAQRGSISSQKSFTSIGNKLLSLSSPSSRSMSRSTSPLQRKSSPLRSVSPLRYVKSKINTDGQSDEIKYLKAQVEELASKFQLLEAEVAAKSRELDEVKSLAADEAEKTKVAKDVIKCLSDQLREITDRKADDPMASSSSDSNHEKHFNNQSNGGKTETSNGTKGQMQKSEMVIHDEPGVYITVHALPSGENELRRVRFSRKHFSEGQAEKWWAENGTKICQRHNIKTP